MPLRMEDRYDWEESRGMWQPRNGQWNGDGTWLRDSESRENSNCCMCPDGEWNVAFVGGAGVKGGAGLGASVSVNLYWVAKCASNQDLTMDGFSGAVTAPFAVGLSVCGVGGGGKIHQLYSPSEGMSVSLGLAGGGGAGAVVGVGGDVNGSVNIYGGEGEISVSGDVAAGMTGLAGSAGFNLSVSYATNVNCNKY